MKKENEEYNYRNCQSLFGYAQKVHERSGGVCQLCRAGSSHVDFDFWRQLTVEHLIGKSQGGYLEQIKSALHRCFSSLPKKAIDRMANNIDRANTITACTFCNSTTSRDQAHKIKKTMDQLLSEAEGSPKRIVKTVVQHLRKIRKQKTKDVQWKLKSVRSAFQKLVEPKLNKARA